jgi:hypothetical protein
MSVPYCEKEDKKSIRGNPMLYQNLGPPHFGTFAAKILVWKLLLCPSCPWDLFSVQVAGFARQAPPQSRPRYFWAHSETKVRPYCPHLKPLGRGGPESFARLTLTRTPLVATLGLELRILGGKPQALEGSGRFQ